MTEETSPSQLSPDHQPGINASATPPSSSPPAVCYSTTLPTSFVSSSSAAQSAGQSSSTLASSIRPSTKPLTSPTAAQSSTLSSSASRSPAHSTVLASAHKTSNLPPASAFTPICAACPQSSSHPLPSTPPSSQPPSPRALRASGNQLSVSSSHNSLDGEVLVSDIYFVSSPFIMLGFVRNDFNCCI